MNKLHTYTDDSGHETFLPFNLPPGRSGNIEITLRREPAGKILPLVSGRNALYMGLTRQSVRLTQATWIHELMEGARKNGSLWMTTMPQELEQHNRQLERAHGHVLVGGLGLGVAVGQLVQNPKVENVTVIEKNRDVIKLVEPHLPRLMNGKPVIVLRRSLETHLQYVKATGWAYDFAFYDTWIPTGEHVLHTHILPLKRLSVGVVPADQIECWNEEEMLGQVRVSIETRLMVGALMPDIHDLNVGQFRRIRAGVRVTYPFWHMMRSVGLTSHEAVHRIDKFVADLRDPAKFDASWGRYS